MRNQKPLLALTTPLFVQKRVGDFMPADNTDSVLLVDGEWVFGWFDGK